MGWGWLSDSPTGASEDAECQGVGVKRGVRPSRGDGPGAGVEAGGGAYN